MYVAVSGVSRTLTLEQRVGIHDALASALSTGDTLITGGAFGVDTCATLWAIFEDIPVFIYAPRDLFWNVGLSGIAGVTVQEVPGTYMDRNDAIADSSAESLLAFPMSKREQARSGTWATARRFQARSKPVTIVALSKFQ